MKNRFSDIFKDFRTGSGFTREYPLNRELDRKGRPVGTGPVRSYKFLLSFLLAVNIVLLTIVAGVFFRKFILHSPLLWIAGSIVAFIVFVVLQAISLVFWLATGIKAPLFQVFYQLPFGKEIFQSICSLLPFTYIAINIALNTCSRIYISEKKAVILLLANCSAAVFLLSRVLSIFFRY